MDIHAKGFNGKAKERGARAMKPHKAVRLILKDQAKEAYETLCKVVEEQKNKSKTNSEEMQLLKSINNKIGILKYNPAYGQNIPKDQIPKTLDADQKL